MTASSLQKERIERADTDSGDGERSRLGRKEGNHFYPWSLSFPKTWAIGTEKEFSPLCLNMRSLRGGTPSASPLYHCMNVHDAHATRIFAASARFPYLSDPSTDRREGEKKRVASWLSRAKEKEGGRG